MKKALLSMCEKMREMSEAEAKAYMRQILQSFQLQVFMGIDALEAFLNSLNRPTSKESKKLKALKNKEKLNKLKRKNSKIAKLLKYRDEILYYHQQGLSLRKIAEIMAKDHRVKVSYQTIRRVLKMLKNESKLK
ncbi:helix-turn-helix domain-containing protein [Deferribacter autotrophicus]|uniref:Helix-turn-helix domain-containing protein n=1 Tax=Deferribacter autotrophicus TaxID=500465 RepID=A0A5A8F4L7_9BACT|nr:helix-turn-helix domain-containing protein [Deferribacter autotrophicus]KAA0259084.1 helix-turn-helix domain-containing protein [Deferribacter autotrophicus]